MDFNEGIIEKNYSKNSISLFDVVILILQLQKIEEGLYMLKRIFLIILQVLG